MSTNDHDDEPVTCVGCCVCPHGRRGTICAVILSVLSYIFLCTASFGCDFMKIDGYLSNEPPYVYKTSVALSVSKIGLFAFQDYGHGVAGTNFVCDRYTKLQIDEYFDGTFKLARGFAVLANICVLIASLVVMMSTCASLHKFILKTASFLFIAGTVFTILMFVVFASEPLSGDPHNRRAGWGVGFNVISILLSAVTGVLLLFQLQRGPIPVQTDNVRENERQRPAQNKQSNKEQPTKKAKRVMPPGAETITETILPDGSRKYITTKWHKDGSSTKTEGIIQP